MMRRRKYLLLVVLTVIAGLIGGAVSNWLFVVRTAGAQEKRALEVEFEQSKKVVVAEEFRLVDGQGKELGKLAIGTDGHPKLEILDRSGSVRALFGLGVHYQPTSCTDLRIPM